MHRSIFTVQIELIKHSFRFDFRNMTTPSDLVPLPFHRTIGRNVRLSNDRTIASRRDTEFSQGYVFTGRPVQLGEKIVIQVSHYFELGTVIRQSAMVIQSKKIPK